MIINGKTILVRRPVGGSVSVSVFDDGDHLVFFVTLDKNVESVVLGEIDFKKMTDEQIIYFFLGSDYQAREVKKAKDNLKSMQEDFIYSSKLRVKKYKNYVKKRMGWE